MTNDKFKLETYYFEMFSKSGENACRSLVKKIFKKIEGKTRVTKNGVIELISKEMERVSKKHSEIYDTEPSYHICHLVNKMCEECGYNFDISRWDI